MTLPPTRIWWPKAFVVLAGLLVCLYAASVLSYVQSIPDIGLECAFTPVVNNFDSSFLRSEAPTTLRFSKVVQLAGHRVHTWPELLRTLVMLRAEPVQAVDPPTLDDYTFVRLHGEKVVRVELQEERGSPL